MAFAISSPHLEVTPAIRNYVQEKVARIERHYGKNIIGMHIFFRVDHLSQKAEAKLSLKRGNEIFVECSDESLYAAIDGLADKLDRRLSKIKAQITEHS